MNLLFIIIIILQICANVNSQPGWDPSLGPSPEPAPGPSWGPSPEPAPGPSWGPSPEPAPGPSWGPSPEPAPGPSLGPTQGTSGDTSRGSTSRSSFWGTPQSSTGGSSRPSQGTCNCGLYETCAMVRHGNAPPQMGCINATETLLIRQALENSNAGAQGTRGTSRDRGAAAQQSLDPLRGGRIDNFVSGVGSIQTEEVTPGLDMLGVGRTPGSGSIGFTGRFDQGINGQPVSDFNINIPGIQGPSGLMQTNPGPNNRGGPPQVIDPTTGQPKLREIVPRSRDIAPIRGASSVGQIVGGSGSRDTQRFRSSSNTRLGASNVNPGRVGSVSGTEPESNTGIQGRVSNIMEDEYGIYYLFYTPEASTGLRVNITKPGFCSRLPPTRSSSACAISCCSDTECGGDLKCCPNGCTLGCVAPYQAQSEQAVQTNTITATASDQPPSSLRLQSRTTGGIRGSISKSSSRGDARGGTGRNGNGNGDLPGIPRRRLSHDHFRAQRRRESFPRQRDGRTRTEFGIDLPNMRLLKTNDVARTRSSEARRSNGQRPRTFRGHRGSGTGSSVQQPDVNFMSRRQGNVQSTPRSGHNSGVQSGSDLATQRVGIGGRHVTGSINRINRHSNPLSRQRQTTTRQVQRRRNNLTMQTRLERGFQTGTGACGKPCREHSECYGPFHFCLAKAPCLERSCQRNSIAILKKNLL